MTHIYTQPEASYTLIDSRDVRRGDHIRAEYDSLRLGAYSALEYIAAYDGDKKGDKMYLIARPKPKSRFDLPKHTIISFPQFTPLINDWDGWHHVNDAASSRHYTNEEVEQRHEGVDFTILYQPEGWEN